MKFRFIDRVVTEVEVDDEHLKSVARGYYDKWGPQISVEAPCKIIDHSQSGPTPVIETSSPAPGEEGEGQGPNWTAVRRYQPSTAPGCDPGSGFHVFPPSGPTCVCGQERWVSPE